MRMSNEMRALMTDITAAREKLQNAVKNRNAEEAATAKSELENLTSLFDAAETDFITAQRMETEPESGGDPSASDKAPKYTAELFYKAITNSASLTDKEREVVAAARKSYSDRYSEGKKGDGGYTVPEDLSTEIYEKIREEQSVRDLVSTEPVKSLSGSRICKGGEANKLYNTEEYEEIQEMNSANFTPISYRQKKFAGIIPLSSELFDDSFINFKSEITDWLSRAARTTENAQVFYGIGGEKHCQGILTTKGAYREVTAPATLDIGFLRRVKFSIKGGYRKNAVWVTNTDGFLAISEIKEDNKSIIQPDPLHEEQYLLLGKTIKVYDDIETEDGKVPLIFGDLKLAYKMFVRKEFGVSITDIAAGAWESDSIKGRGIERFDGRIVDNNALVIVRDVPVTPLEITNLETDFGAADEITKESLSYLTKPQLLALATEYGVEGLTDTSKKNTIIDALLQAIAPTDAPTDSGDTGGETV